VLVIVVVIFLTAYTACCRNWFSVSCQLVPETDTSWLVSETGTGHRLMCHGLKHDTSMSHRVHSLPGKANLLPRA